MRWMTAAVLSNTSLSQHASPMECWMVECYVGGSWTSAHAEDRSQLQNAV